MLFIFLTELLRLLAFISPAYNTFLKYVSTSFQPVSVLGSLIPGFNYGRFSAVKPSRLSFIISSVSVSLVETISSLRPMMTRHDRLWVFKPLKLLHFFTTATLNAINIINSHLIFDNWYIALGCTLSEHRRFGWMRIRFSLTSPFMPFIWWKICIAIWINC